MKAARLENTSVIRFERDGLSELPLMGVFLRERKRLKRIVAGLGVGAADVEDVLQDVSVEAMKKGDEKMADGMAVGWLVRVTVNRALLEHRKKTRFIKLIGNLFKRDGKGSKSEVGPDNEIILREERAAVREVLEKIDERLLGPLVLRYFCDYNSVEIAEMLEVKAVTVRSRLRDGRMVLAKGLKEKGVTE